MSKQVWAVEQMMKHRFQVDFSRRTIECRGFHDIWIWDFNDGPTDFYAAIQQAVKDIEKYYES